MTDDSNVPKHVKKVMEMTEILNSCKTPTEAGNILANATLNFFLLHAKPGRALSALKSYYIDLKEKVVAAEEAGIIDFIENVKNIPEDDIKTIFEALKKSVKGMTKKGDFDFRQN